MVSVSLIWSPIESNEMSRGGSRLGTKCEYRAAPKTATLVATGLLPVRVTKHALTTKLLRQASNLDSSGNNRLEDKAIADDRVELSLRRPKRRVRPKHLSTNTMGDLWNSLYICFLAHVHQPRFCFRFG